MIKEWLALFQSVGRVYQKRTVDAWWERFPNHGSDTLESLQIFLQGYAFERQGAPEAYRPIAGEALRLANSRPLDPNEVWGLFKKESMGKGLKKETTPSPPKARNAEQRRERRLRRRAFQPSNLRTNCAPQSSIGSAKNCRATPNSSTKNCRVSPVSDRRLPPFSCATLRVDMIAFPPQRRNAIFCSRLTSG